MNGEEACYSGYIVKYSKYRIMYTKEFSKKIKIMNLLLKMGREKKLLKLIKYRGFNPLRK